MLFYFTNLRIILIRDILTFILEIMASIFVYISIEHKKIMLFYRIIFFITNQHNISQYDTSIA